MYTLLALSINALILDKLFSIGITHSVNESKPSLILTHDQSGKHDVSLLPGRHGLLDIKLNRSNNLARIPNPDLCRRYSPAAILRYDVGLAFGHRSRVGQLPVGAEPTCAISVELDGMIRT